MITIAIMGCMLCIYRIRISTEIEMKDERCITHMHLAIVHYSMY